MTTQNIKDIRGITWPVIKAITVSTITVCGAIIGGVVHIEKTFANHEYRITQIETKQKEHTDKIETLFITQSLKSK